MWNYAELSQLAKALGGPEQLVKALTMRGIEIGIKQAKGKYGLIAGLGAVGGAVATSLVYLVVNHFKKNKEPDFDSNNAVAQVLIDGINAYDEGLRKDPSIAPLPEISREEAEARIDKYVQEVANETTKTECMMGDACAEENQK